MKYSYIETPDYQQIKTAFHHELTLAAQGTKTSLPWIKNILPNHALVKKGDIFQSFVIGGTSGAVAMVIMDDTSFHIMRYRQIPLLPKFTTADEFFSFIEDNLDSRTTALAINFAFTLIPTVGDADELDGVMISGETKGHAFHGLQGKEVGKATKEYFKAKHRELFVSVANDTVCLLTSAIGEEANKNNIAAGIVGTGYNMAFFLDNQTVVNTQAGDFTGFTPTRSGKIIDDQSTNKGEQLFNKEVAAGELFKHFNIFIPELSLQTKPLNSTEELALLAQQDIGIPSLVARELFHRSASLVAAQIAGFSEYTHTSERITFVMEGSLFWKGPSYKKIVTEQIEKLGVPEGKIVFKKIEHSGIIGAAKLVTGE